MKDRSKQFPVEEIAPLFEQYIDETLFPDILNREFSNDLTKPIRSMVYEDVVPESVEIIDFESAIKVFENEEEISVQHCPCRRLYYTSHPEEDSSEYPSETCFLFGMIKKDKKKYISNY
jgi:hypothetical protein